MKRLVIAMACILGSLTQANAQYDMAEKFNGYWKIELKHIDPDYGDDIYSTVVYIEDGDVELLGEEDGQVFVQNTHYDEVAYNYYDNNLSFFWINTGGVWTETQSYSLSYVKDGLLKVRKMRQVNNEKEGDENEVWGYFQEGHAKRVLR